VLCKLHTNSFFSPPPSHPPLQPCGFPCKNNGTRVWLLMNDAEGRPIEPELTAQCMWAEPDYVHLRQLMRYGACVRVCVWVVLCVFVLVLLCAY